MRRVTELEIQVRSTDMDADQIVNNARYFEYFEQVRLEHLTALGIVTRPPPSGRPSRPFTLAETTCRYRAPARHRDLLTARAWTQEVGTRSFVLGYQIVRGDDGSLVAEGSSAQVWLNAESRPAPLDGDVRTALQASMDA
ncbi:MAG: acyl-CoA thioesterase [Streptosporangiaceae bacterium]